VESEAIIIKVDNVSTINQ